jgi:hypothetical protein
MHDPTLAERQILEELQSLEPWRWFEVLDYIGYLKQHPLINRSRRELTAHDLLQSPLLGLWEDRDDLQYSLSYALQLRNEAEHRSGDER